MDRSPLASPLPPNPNRLPSRTAAWLFSLTRLFLLTRLVAVGCSPGTSTNFGTFAGTDSSGGDDTGSVSPGDDTQGQPPTSKLSQGDPVELVTNTKYFGRANEVIQTAQQKLRVVQFETGVGDAPDLLVKALIGAQNRGVDVKVLLDQEIAYNKDTMDTLKAAGVSVIMDSSKLRTHAKIVASEQGFVIGSTNWSSTSISKNNETNILVRDAGLTAQLHTWLDKLWKTPNINVSMPSGGSTVATLYADGGFAALAGPMLDGAKSGSTILLCTYGMNVDPTDGSSMVTKTVNKIGAAVTRGAKVQVVLDMSYDAGDGSAAFNKAAGDYLKKLGCDVKIATAAKITHAKFMVVDNTVIMGSNNWGYGGFTSYHEVGAKFSGNQAVSDLKTYFGGLWTTGTAWQ